MSDFTNALLNAYIPLVGWTLVGCGIGRVLPEVAATYLGRFLFWVGVPIGIASFMRGADLSGLIWVAPATAWIAILVGAGFALVWLDIELREERLRSHSSSAWGEPTQGSFLLAMMVGNTGYMGFPVVLALVGPEYFSWALFYDLLGTAIGVYGLGVAIAARYGKARSSQRAIVRVGRALSINPALWSLAAGVWLRTLDLAPLVDRGLSVTAWTVVSLSLILIGMKLGRLRSLGKLGQALPCLAIKMLIVPLVVGTVLMFVGVTGPPRLALVLQMGMPPAFATLTISEAYQLDRDLAVAALALGSLGLLFVLPLWAWLFGS